MRCSVNLEPQANYHTAEFGYLITWVVVMMNNNKDIIFSDFKCVQTVSVVQAKAGKPSIRKR